MNHGEDLWLGRSRAATRVEAALCGSQSGFMAREQIQKEQETFQDDEWRARIRSGPTVVAATPFALTTRRLGDPAVVATA